MSLTLNDHIWTVIDPRARELEVSLVRVSDPRALKVVRHFVVQGIVSDVRELDRMQSIAALFICKHCAIKYAL